jgi:hypothetical protein
VTIDWPAFVIAQHVEGKRASARYVVFEQVTRLLVIFKVVAIEAFF